MLFKNNMIKNISIKTLVLIFLLVTPIFAVSAPPPTSVITKNGSSGGGGGGAPTDATYVTISTDATLTNERTLAVSPNLSLTDAGAGSTVTLANLEPDRIATCTEEYMSYLATWDCGFTSTSGAGAAITADSTTSSEAAHPGTIKLVTGTTATGYARRLFSNSNLIYAGSATIRWDSIFNITTLSDGTDTFTLSTGLRNVTNFDGCYVQYSHGLNSGNFLYVSEAGASQTTSDSGVTVAAATWYHIVVEIAADRSACTFSINNANNASINTNIIAAGTTITPGTFFDKSVGLTSRALVLDLHRIRLLFSSAR